MTDAEIRAAHAQAARYAVACAQDRSPIIALQHCSYARNTWEGLLAMMTRRRFWRVTGERIAPWLESTRRGQHGAQRVLETRFPLKRPGLVVAR